MNAPARYQRPGGVCVWPRRGRPGLRCFETEFRNSLHSQQYTLVSSLVSGIDKKLRLARDAMVASSRHLPYAALAAPELAQLRTFGCDDVQGPLVARPMPAADMEHFLRERR